MKTETSTNTLVVNQKEMYAAAHDRFVEAGVYLHESGFVDEFTGLSKDDWLQLDDDQYQSLERYTRGLYERTTAIGSPETVQRLRLNPDFPSLVEHIRIAQHMMGQYEEVGVDMLYEESSTSAYKKAKVLLHDFSRFSGFNGSLPPTVIDGIDDVLMKRFMPGFPAEDHLHHIDQVTGKRQIPLDKPAALFMKLLDTCGKPDRRYPETFFAPGGRYEGWMDYERQKGTFPLTLKDTEMTSGSNPKPVAKITEVSLELYAENDKTFTLAAYKLIQETFKPLGLDFNDAIDRACDEINVRTDLVETFGI